MSFVAESDDYFHLVGELFDPEWVRMQFPTVRAVDWLLEEFQLLIGHEMSP